MRIRCTGCGREYRVSEERLTGGAIRAKCRSCGRMLHIRMRKGDATERAEPPAAPGEVGREPETAQPIGRGAYRFCIACGGSLDPPVGPTGRPVCSKCESTGAARRRSRSAGLATDLAGAGHRGRFFFYMAVVLAVLASAYLGYRLAVGSTAAVVVSGTETPQTAPRPNDRAG